MKAKPLLAIYFALLMRHSLFGQGIVWQASQSIAQTPDSSITLAFNNTAIIAAASGIRYLVWEQRDSILLAMSNDGKIWRAPRFIHKGIGLSKPTVAAQNNGAVFMAWQERLGGFMTTRVIHSANNGETWNQPAIISNGGNNDGVALIAGEPNKFFATWFSMAGNEAHIWFSAYNGSIWSAPKQLDNSPAQALWSALATSGNKIYAVWRENTTGQFRVYLTRSTDDGDTWETPRNIVAINNTSDPSVAATKDGHVIVAYQQTVQIKAVTSADFGVTFSAPQTISLKGQFARVVANENGFVGIAFERFFDLAGGTRNNAQKHTGFAYSRNSGASFSADTALANIGGGVFGSASMTTAEEVTACWAQYGNGTSSVMIRRGMIPQVTGVTAPKTLPENFMLTSYPNPLQTSANAATIRFSLLQREHVTLKVFNSTGQEVATLANAEMEAGVHNLIFNAAGLPSGVYFYRVQTPSFAQTRKTVSLR